MDTVNHSTLEQASRKVAQKLSSWRMLMFFILLPTVILLGSGLLVWLLNQRSAVDGDLQRELDSVWYWEGESVLVNLVPKLESPTAQMLTDRADVVFALDISGSMGSSSRPGDALYEALSVIRRLTDILPGAGVKVGFIDFDHQARLSAPLGAKRSELRSAWGNLPEGGGTNIAAAIRTGMDELKANSSSDKKLLIIVTDGGDSVDDTRALATEAIVDNIHLVGIGIGTNSGAFFDTAFNTNVGSDYHLSRQWDNDEAALFRFMQDILLHANLQVLDSLGHTVRLLEYPHIAAMPLMGETPNALQDQFGIGYSQSILSGKPEESTAKRMQLIFEMLYFFNAPHHYSYILEADAWGVHPVAREQASLSYYANDSNQKMMLGSGISPRILVISPWLLLLMYLPALLYLLHMLLNRKPQISLMHPSQLPVPGHPLALADLPNHRFKYRSLTLQTELDEDAIPTLVIAIGGSAGNTLAALLHARREIGASAAGENTAFYPLYLDCLTPTEDKFPHYLDVALTPETLFNLYDDSSVMPGLAELIQAVNENPSDHLAARWFRATDYENRLPDIQNGCGGDRQLARFLLYRDLLADRPRQHQLREKIASWCQRHQQRQIFIIISDTDGLGSGWSVDIAHHVRKALAGQVVPLYLFLSLASENPTAIMQGNQKALMTELHTLQNAAGQPYHNMDRNNDGKVNTEQMVLLPLFDRVVRLEHQSEAAAPGLAAATLLQLMDAEAQAEVKDSLRDWVWKYRNSGYRAGSSEQDRGSGFISVLDTSVFYLPLEIWRQIWALRALQDALQAVIGFEVKDGVVSLTESVQGISDWKQVWQEVAATKTRPILGSLYLWGRISGNDEVLGQAQHLPEPDCLSLELIKLVVGYLNVSDPPTYAADQPAYLAARLGRFAKIIGLLEKWRDYLSSSPRLNDIADKFLPAAQASVEQVLTQLMQWQSTLLQEDRNQPEALLTQVARQLRVLQEQLPPDIDEPGRFGLVAEQWQTNPDENYSKKIHPAIIDNGALPARIRWDCDNSGGKIQLRISQYKYNIDDIHAGKMQADIYSILKNVLLIDLYQWNIDESLATDKLDNLLQTVPVKDEAKTFLFHGFQADANNRHIQQNRLFSHPRIVRHGYRDRLVFMSFDENRFFPVVDECDSQAAELPFIQPHAQNLVILNRQYAGQCGRNIDRADPNSKLLVQSMGQLELGLLALLSGWLNKVGGHDLAHWNLSVDQTMDQDSPLTALGDDSLGNAIRQLLLRGTDINGQALPVDALRKNWYSLDSDDRAGRLKVWIANTQQRSQCADWERLILVKAQVDLLNHSGVLS